MKLGFGFGWQLWSPLVYYPSSPSFAPCSLALPFSKCRSRRCRLSVVAEAVESIEATQDQPLSARERRKLRNERREAKTVTNWREKVEERLSKKPKKQHVTLKAQRNLNHLANLGPQWWILRVSSIRRQKLADILKHSIPNKFPDLDFDIYAPTVQEKRRLKNGSYAVKPKPIFSGCIFLRCVLNKEIHDFLKEEGVGGFLGNKVGTRKSQIKIPRPVSDMETIFQRAKEEQEKADQAFEEEEKKRMNAVIPDADSVSNVSESVVEAQAGRQSKKSSDTHSSSPVRGRAKRLPATGSTVRITSGNFAGFEGSLTKLNRKTKKATVVFTLLGREILEDVDVTELVSVTD